MDILGDELIITFGFQDNAAYILKAPISAIEEFINTEKDVTEFN